MKSTLSSRSDVLSSSDEDELPLAAEKSITLFRKVNFSSFISIPPGGAIETIKTSHKKKKPPQKIQKRKSFEVVEEKPPEKVEQKRTLPSRKSASSKRKNISEQRVKIPNPNPKTRLTEMDWHLDNIRTILNCSNATPIHAKEDGGHSCSYCFQKFTKLTELKKHCFSHHKKGKPDFLKMRPGKILSKHIVYLDISSLKCRVCRADIESLEMLMEHLQNAHDETMHLVIKNQIMPLRVVDENLRCAVCAVDIDFDKVADHMSQHYRNYVCEFCDASFVIRCKMLDHKKTVHDCFKGTYTIASSIKNKEGLCGKRIGVANVEYFADESGKTERKYIKKKKIIIIKPSVESGAQLQLVTKKFDELSKHQVNIRTILLCSTATPIRKYGGVGYMCCYCSREFPDPRLLKSHTRRAHDDTSISNFMGSQSLAGFVVKLDITDLHCTLCESPFSSVEDIADHLSAIHDRSYHHDVKSHIIPFRFSDTFRCVVCETQFSNFKVLLEHMNVHFRNHICEICGKGYVNKVQFQTHMYRHNTGVFNCSVCCKVFDTRVKWKQHERATHVLMNRRSKCGYCGERFKDYTKKNEHEVRSHGASAVVLHCRACERSFNNQRALNAHTKTYHLMERKVPK